MKTKPIILTLIRLALLGLWMPVAVDKLWNLSGFHSTLLRQPFPGWWADVLFWLLPVLELLAAVLIAWPQKTSLRGMRPARASRSNLPPAYLPLRLGLWLSTTLMLAFTLFILFGVLGWYAKRPCGCGSVISGLSWEQHLWFNAVFLLLSIIGIWFTRARTNRHLPYRNPLRLLSKHPVANTRSLNGSWLHTIRFPRKFAVFRRRAWLLINLSAPFPRDNGEGT